MMALKQFNQTAVQWLIGQYYDNEGAISIKQLEQAEEMEKQQSINDFVAGNKLDFYDATEKEIAEMYYNETYGGNK
jgi:hypothetical protein